MIAASTKFISALSASHRRLLRVTLDGNIVPTSGGGINMDPARNVRRTGSLTLVKDPVYASMLSSLSTASTCIIEQGIQYLDGLSEYITTGTVKVQSAKPTKTAWMLTFSDRGQDVEDYPLIFPWAPVSGGVSMLVQAAIVYLVEEATTVPGWDIDLDAAQLAQACPDGMLFTAGTGRWTAITQLAESIGARVYVQANGRWRIQQQRLVTTPNYDIISGNGGTLVKADSSMDRKDAHNGVAIEWGTTDIPGGVILEYDDDPGSPTYWFGTWGKKPMPTKKLPLGSEAEARIAAKAILAQSRGDQGGLDLSTAYDPRLEPDDVIGITQSDVARQVHIFDKININLGGAIMTSTTRQVG